MKRLKLAFVATLSVIFLHSCSDDNVQGTAQFRVSLTDAPGDYQQVNVDIQSIEIHRSGDETESGWQILNLLEPGVYNLLDFTNGHDTLLISEELEVGKVSQIRLVLGDDNTVMVDSVLKDLKTPSGQQSGLKLNVNTDLTTGITYSIVLDFDASRSVVEAGNSGNYNLKPVIRVITEATDGGIKGVIAPDTLNAAIFAIKGVDTVGSMAGDGGAFMIRGLEAGVYDVVVVPEDSLDKVTEPDVNVNLGEITELDTLFIL